MSLVGIPFIEIESYRTGKIIEQSNNYVTLLFDDGSTAKYAINNQFSNRFDFGNSDTAVNQYVDNFQKKWKKRVAEQKKKEADNSYMLRQVKWYSLKDDPRQYCMPAFVEESIIALEKEKSDSKSKKRAYSILKNGETISANAGEYIYAFEPADSTDYIPQSTVKTVNQSSTYSGQIDSVSEDTIILIFQEPLDRIDQLAIQIDADFLIDKIIQRLKALERGKHPLSYQLVEENKKNLLEDKTENRTILPGYEDQPISMIWGPPGTGKTEVIKNIAIDAYQKGKKVLILSHTNTAIDEATLRIDSKSNLNSFLKNKSLQQCDDFSIGRFGYVKDKRIASNPYLSIYDRIIEKNPGYLLEQDKLRQELTNFRKEQNSLNKENKNDSLDEEYVKRRKQELADAIKGHKQRLSEIKTIIDELQKEEALKMKILLMTISQAISRDAFFSHKWDIVIVDEASICYIPQIVLCAGLSRAHFICVGDFLQLAPVTLQKQSILIKDIFWFCRIPEAVKEHKSHKWLFTLNIQRRLPQAITDFLSVTFYQNILESEKKNEEEENFQRIKCAKKKKNAPVHVVNLASPENISISDSTGSKMNLGNALSILFIILRKNCKSLQKKNFSLGIITPYRNQVRLYESLIKDLSGEYPYLNNITISTVHRFQGSEKTWIYYDLVDNPNKNKSGYRKIGRIHSSLENDSANRLFNVAISRTKESFVIAGAVDFMKEQLNSNHLLYQMLNTRKPTNINVSNRAYYFEMDEAKKIFLKDIESAKEQIIFSFPSLPMKSNFLKEIIASLKNVENDEDNKSELQIWIRKDYQDRFIDIFQYINSSCFYDTSKELIPLAIIDDTIWFPNPLSIDDSFSKNKECIRIIAPHSKDILLNLANLNTENYRITEEEDQLAIFVKKNLVCTDCGHPLSLRVNYNGNPYLYCEKCRNSFKITRQILEQYLNKNGRQVLCRQHGTPIVLSKNYGCEMKCTCKHHSHTVTVKQL